MVGWPRDGAVIIRPSTTEFPGGRIFDEIDHVARRMYRFPGGSRNGGSGIYHFADPRRRQSG